MKTNRKKTLICIKNWLVKMVT